MNPVDLAEARFRPIRQARAHIQKAEAANDRSRARLQELSGQVGAVEHADRKALGAALVAGRAEPAAEAAKLKAEIAAEERRAEALELAVNDANSQIGRVVDVHRDAWRRQTVRELNRAARRYQAAIAELAAAREALANEATLIGWLDSGEMSEAATEALGAVPRTDNKPVLGLSTVIEELRRNCDHLTGYPDRPRGGPQPEPRFEMATGGGSKRWE